MKIDDVFKIEGRGYVAVIVLDCPELSLGTQLRRTSDGAVWTLRGLEWFAIPRRPGAGDRVGLLLDGEGTLEIGDDIQVDLVV